MCIIFFIASDEHSPNSGYKLILASNRDEMYARPTKAAAPWRNEEYVIAGDWVRLIRNVWQSLIVQM